MPDYSLGSLFRVRISQIITTPVQTPSIGPRGNHLAMAEPYKRIGRGGAGNFYGPKDIEDASMTGAGAAAAAVPSPFLTCVKKWLFRGFFVCISRCRVATRLACLQEATARHSFSRPSDSSLPPPINVSLHRFPDARANTPPGRSRSPNFYHNYQRSNSL